MDRPQLRRQFCSLRECLSAEEVSAASTALCHRLSYWLPSQLPHPHTPTLPWMVTPTQEIHCAPLWRTECTLS
jgi:hypothetical protein